MIRRDPSILPYGPTAKMLRDSDPEKACAIKCYSTDSKEVLRRIIMMGKMTIRLKMRRMAIRSNIMSNLFCDSQNVLAYGDGEYDYEDVNDNGYGCAKVSRSWSFPDGTVCYLDRSSSRSTLLLSIELDIVHRSEKLWVKKKL